MLAGISANTLTAMQSRRCAVLAASVTMFGCGAANEGSLVAAVEAASGDVDVVSSARLPFSDMSGLGVRPRTEAGRRTLLAVGDARPAVVSIELRDGARPSAPVIHDLSSIFGHGESQFEAVTADGSGRVFVLVESRSEIAVLSPDLTRRMTTMKLVFPSGHPLADRWAADDNSRGEGMLLLANGHVLVAKEKKPAAIVEFVPRGSSSEGYRPDLALREGAFPMTASDSGELVASAHWTLDEEDGDRLGDISELSIDEDGSLLLLSDQGRAIARIGPTLDASNSTISPESILRLPSLIDKPEGLAIVDGRVFVATDDRDASRDTLFEVRLPPPEQLP